MISFEIDGVKFNYRVAAIILDNKKKKILLTRGIKQEYWYLPGGRVEAFEFSREALIREIKEEMNIRIEVSRPIFVIENLFLLEGKKVHEIGIYYSAHFHENDSIFEEKDEFFHKDEIGKEIVFKWFEIKGLKDVDLRPAFLKDKITNIPPNFELIENKE